MLHAEYLTGNPITGRQVWMIRHIQGDKFGMPWDWRVDVIRPHHFSKTAILMGGEGAIATFHAYKQINQILKIMRFKRAAAMRKGRWKTYRVK